MAVAVTGAPTTDTYRIDWRAASAYSAPGRVVAEVHPADRTVTLTLSDGQSVVADVVAARAIEMLLHHCVFGVLQPLGPFLAIEAADGDEWRALRWPR